MMLLITREMVMRDAYNDPFGLLRLCEKRTGIFDVQLGYRPWYIIRIAGET